MSILQNKKNSVRASQSNSKNRERIGPGVKFANLISPLSSGALLPETTTPNPDSHLEQQNLSARFNEFSNLNQTNVKENLTKYTLN
jgi:hypothetical protein